MHVLDYFPFVLSKKNILLVRTLKYLVSLSIKEI